MQYYRTIYLGWGSIIKVTIVFSLILIIEILAGNMFVVVFCSESVSSSEELVEEVDKAEDDEESVSSEGMVPWDQVSSRNLCEVMSIKSWSKCYFVWKAKVISSWKTENPIK